MLRAGASGASFGAPGAPGAPGASSGACLLEEHILQGSQQDLYTGAAGTESLSSHPRPPRVLEARGRPDSATPGQTVRQVQFRSAGVEAGRESPPTLSVSSQDFGLITAGALKLPLQISTVQSHSAASVPTSHLGRLS